MNKRIEYIDVAKGILILLVVFGHAYHSCGIHFEALKSNHVLFAEIREWIYTFHMPAFFIISGIFLKTNLEFKNYMINKIKQILIPLAIFEAITFIVYCTIYDNYGFHNVIEQIKSHETLNTVNWFLVSLFVSDVLFYFISKTNRAVRIAIAVSLLALSYMIGKPFICRTLIGLFFITIGNEFGRKINGFSTFDNYKLTAICIFTSAILWYFDFNIDIYYGEIGTPITLLAGAMAGYVIVISVAKKFSGCKFLNMYGRNSLFVLGTHYLIIDIYKAVCGESERLFIAITVIFVIQTVLVFLYAFFTRKFSTS